VSRHFCARVSSVPWAREKGLIKKGARTLPRQISGDIWRFLKTHFLVFQDRTLGSWGFQDKTKLAKHIFSRDKDCTQFLYTTLDHRAHVNHTRKGINTLFATGRLRLQGTIDQESCGRCCTLVVTIALRFLDLNIAELAI